MEFREKFSLIPVWMDGRQPFRFVPPKTIRNTTSVGAVEKLIATKAKHFSEAIL